VCRNGEQCSSNNDVKTLHVGKKLCNLLFLAIKVVFWGKYMASKNHILLVFENFNIDQHGLLKEDINVKDKKKNHYYILCLFAKGKNKKSEGFAKQKQPAIFVM